MKIAQPITHDDKTYNYGDEISAEDAKNLPEGYAVSEGDFKKLEEEAAASTSATPTKPVEEMTDEELANHPSQAPTVPQVEPVVEDGSLVAPQPTPKAPPPDKPAEKK
jgi:hypothetical protein